MLAKHTSSLFWAGYFGDEVYLPGVALIFLISASQVARIASVSHQLLAFFFF
jgi:hypothetical protein